MIMSCKTLRDRPQPHKVGKLCRQHFVGCRRPTLRDRPPCLKPCGTDRSHTKWASSVSQLINSPGSRLQTPRRSSAPYRASNGRGQENGWGQSPISYSLVAPRRGCCLELGSDPMASDVGCRKSTLRDRPRCLKPCGTDRSHLRNRPTPISGKWASSVSQLINSPSSRLQTPRRSSAPTLRQTEYEGTSQVTASSVKIGSGKSI